MFFYDGTDPKEVSELFSKGIISGVTTNLTLVNKKKKETGLKKLDVLDEIVAGIEEYPLCLSIQVDANLTTEIVTEGKLLNERFGRRIDLYIKVPINFSNLSAIRELSCSGVKVNATCVTSFLQGKLATLGGAKIVSFFWGKMYDQGIDPSSHVRAYREWVDHSFLENKPILLVGSVRQIGSIEAAFRAGADVVTTGLDNFKKMSGQLASDQANFIFQESL